MSDCILWNGHLWSQGRYGMDKIDKKSMGAHRAAWIRKYGEIPEGMVVCHTCDVTLCVNTDHLFLGTNSDNMQDCIKKGRFHRPNQKGQNNRNASPGLEKRNADIRMARLAGKTYSEIKREFGIKSNGHLRNILAEDAI